MPKGSKKRRADKRKKKELQEKTKANDAAEPPPPPPNSQSSKENEGEKVLVGDELVATDTVVAEEMTQIEDQFEEAVIAEQIAEEMTQAVMAAYIEAQLEDAVIAEEIAEEMTQAILVADIADPFEEAVVAVEMTQALVARDRVDQFEEAVISKEITQVLLNKKVDQSANLAARDSFLFAEQNLNQYEGNLLASSEVERKNSNEDMVAMGTDKQVPILDVSCGDETYTEMVSPVIGLQLNRIKEVVETGLSIADNMKELFLIIMDDLNAILNA